MPTFSLAFDPSGNPAISYFNGIDSSVKLARWNGTAWSIETVDGTSYDARGYTSLSSLAFDPAGNPVISYYDGTNGDLKYATQEAATWYVDFAPDTLNLGSNGRFVTVYIELPVGYDASQIDISSIMLNGTLPALAKPAQVGDHDMDGIPDLMVKFDRAAVQDILTVGEQVEITITGEVAGITFEGSDTIRVIDG